MHMKKNGIIIKEFAGNTLKKTKLYVMPATLEEKIIAGIKKINGTLHITQETQHQLGSISTLTLDEQALTHVAAVELVHERGKGSYFQGFHLDPHKALQRMGLINVRNCVVDETAEIITSKAQLRKGRLKDKTFFPDHWTIDDILRNAQEALLNLVGGIECQGKRNVIMGQTKKEISIEFVIDSFGKIVSFYPV